MDEFLVFRKTGLAVAELTATHGGTLSSPARRVLILLDGRRTIAELSDLFGAEAVETLIPHLEAQGFAKRIDPRVEGADQVTQLLPNPATLEAPLPAADAPSGAPHPLRWIALAAALAIGGGAVVVARFGSQAAPAPPPGQAAGQVQPIEVDRALAVADAVDGDGAERPRPITVMPISGLPAVAALKTAAATPGRAEQQPVADARPAERAQTQDAPPAPEPPAAARSAPAASPVAPLAIKVDAPAAPALAPQSVAAPRAPPAPVAIAAASPASPAPAPVVSVDAGRGDTPGAAATDAARTGVAAGGAAGNQLATLGPPPQLASAPITLRPVKHDPPQFPGRAVRAGILDGHVKARVWITAEGSVEQVDIVLATPARVFDDEVRRALSTWTYEPPGHPTQTTVELTFKP
jgi:periplasmic protein TonB